MHINSNKTLCNIDQGCPKINSSYPVKKLVQPFSQNMKSPQTAEVGLSVIFWWCWGMLVTVYYSYKPIKLSLKLVQKWDL